MDKKFEIDFLGEAIDFMASLEEKTRRKIYYNARKAQFIVSPLPTPSFKADVKCVD